MAAFYLKTEETAVGPFSGVELREAALAGILRPDTEIAGSANGPWIQASNTGLFSEKNIPLPHPSDTELANFQVRGGIGGISDMQGPFKLRELIGFATRGLMPNDTIIRSDQSPEWFPVHRINILSACLGGLLVLIDAKGNVVRRTTASAKNKVGSTPVSLAATRTPTRRRAVDTSSDDTGADEAYEDEAFPEAIKHDSAETNTLVATRGSLEEDESTLEAGETDAMRWWQRELSISGVVSSLRGGGALLRGGRWIIAAACSIVLLVGIATAFSKYRGATIVHADVVGDWIADDSTFGVGFHPDGTCVVFDTRSDSWTGHYEWKTWVNRSGGYSGIEPFTSHVVKPAQDHVVSPIDSTDGYIHLRGHSRTPTQIGKIEMRDCFARRPGEQLQIGYLATIVGDSNGKTMYAGWMTLNPSPAIVGEPMLDLAAMEFEPPPEVGFSNVKAPHVSVVVSELTTAYERADPAPNLGSVCYSVKVDAAYLLKNYGVPDEARPLSKIEIKAMVVSKDFVDAQMVRYGHLKLVLSPDGSLLYATIVH